MHTPIVPTLVLALSVCLPAAAGGYEALSFTGFAAKTQITDQYASQGILLGFPSSAGNITQSDAYMYAQDGWGIVGVGSIIASFTQPMYAFAMYYPSSARFRFYSLATTQGRHLRDDDAAFRRLPDLGREQLRRIHERCFVRPRRDRGLHAGKLRDLRGQHVLLDGSCASVCGVARAVGYCDGSPTPKLSEPPCTRRECGR